MSLHLEQLNPEQLAAVTLPDQHALILAGAGSGKTRLALRWVQRALNRGDRVLLVSYNDPLGDQLAGVRADDAAEPPGLARVVANDDVRKLGPRAGAVMIA